MTSSAVSANGGWRGENWVARLLLGYARKFPKHRGKSRAFEALAGLCFPRGMALSENTGARICVDPLDYIGWEICFKGSFEPLSLALARRIMNGGGTFLDVGANFGLFSCSLAVLPGVECIAVDASPAAFLKLQENLRRNREAKITAVNVALGAERCLVSLVPARPGNLGTGHVADSRSAGDHRERVMCTTLDELMGELNAGPIKLMKIDVEGHEPEVFRGLDFDAKYAPEHIISEYCVLEGKISVEMEDGSRLLRAKGYEPFTVEGSAYTAGEPLPENNLWWRRAI
jgi:FkbM family methyltransferase